MNDESMKLRYLALTLALGTAAFAQTDTTPTDTPHRGGPRGPHGRGHFRGHPVVHALDADQNGTLSAAEIAGASAALLTLDRNADGALSSDELHPGRPDGDRPADAPARPAGAADHPHPVDPIMLALDADSDHALSANEIANAKTSLLALDANKDGALTPDEYRPLPPARPANE